MPDTNHGPNGYLTQEGRVAYNMSQTRLLLHNKAKQLRDLDARIKKAKQAIADDEGYRPGIVKELEELKLNHQKAMEVYTNSTWMDIQAKPEEPAETGVVAA